VINKHLSAEQKKDKDTKGRRKRNCCKAGRSAQDCLNELKTILVDKLLTSLFVASASQGVSTIYGEAVVPKGEKFTQSLLRDIDYTTIDYSNWTTSDDPTA
jgi:DNA-directed RNA polymerase subunit beta